MTKINANLTCPVQKVEPEHQVLVEPLWQLGIVHFGLVGGELLQDCLLIHNLTLRVQY